MIGAASLRIDVACVDQPRRLWVTRSARSGQRVILQAVALQIQQ